MKNQLSLEDLQEITLPVKLKAYAKFNRFHDNIEVLYIGNHELFIRDLEDGLEHIIPVTDIKYYRLDKTQASKDLICDSCGKQDETVRDTICPYANEIHDEIIEMCLCGECYEQKADDI